MTGPAWLLLESFYHTRTDWWCLELNKKKSNTNWSGRPNASGRGSPRLSSTCNNTRAWSLHDTRKMSHPYKMHSRHSHVNCVDGHMRHKATWKIQHVTKRYLSWSIGPHKVLINRKYHVLFIYFSLFSLFTHSLTHPCLPACLSVCLSACLPACLPYIVHILTYYGYMSFKHLL